MLLSADTMRFLLVACMVGIALLALLYLRKRILSPWEYLAWGLLVVLLPFLGPFLVILLKPGAARRSETRRFPLLGRKL
jgi:cytochrome bd-type quinol oxidase subunit 2